jgi:hypothetical protein
VTPVRLTPTATTTTANKGVSTEAATPARARTRARSPRQRRFSAGDATPPKRECSENDIPYAEAVNNNNDDDEDTSNNKSMVKDSPLPALEKELSLLQEPRKVLSERRYVFSPLLMHCSPCTADSPKRVSFFHQFKVFKPLQVCNMHMYQDKIF